MDPSTYTLQGFYLFTESVTYIIILAILVVFPGFWLFLTGRDKED